MVDYLGYIAGFLVTFSIVPQIIRVYKLKSAREISVLFNTALLLGTLCWMAYGILLGLIPIIVWNCVGLVLLVLLLLAKVRYGREKLINKSP